MIAVKAEGAEYIYFSRAERALVPTTLGLSVRIVPPFMEGQLQRHGDDIRLVLVRSLPQSNIGLGYYLHWDNDQDLDALDRRVETATYSDDDFVHSAKTVYQLTRCMTCRRTWQTLVMPLGDPYVGAHGLYDRKIRDHAIIAFCPACGARFRQLVVKIFGLLSDIAEISAD